MPYTPKYFQPLLSTKQPHAASRQAAETRGARAMRPRRLLAVGCASTGRSALKDYAVQLGRRIGCEAVLLTLTAPVPPGAGPDESRRDTGRPSGVVRLTPAGRTDLQPLIECSAQQSDLLPAVEELCREIKRIEFILTDSEPVRNLLSENAVIPVFRIVADTAPSNGGCQMSKAAFAVRKKPVGKTVFFGLLTAVLYAAVFWKSEELVRFFARGGVYAALPIATAIVFSFAHGAFASNLWSLLGIRARTQADVRTTVSPAARAPKAPKRPRVYAYVNPFHNIELKKK